MIEFTKIKSTKKANKTYQIVDGKTEIKSGAKIQQAIAEKVNVNNLSEFADILNELTIKECLSIGVFPEDVCNIVRSDEENPSKGKYGRNKKNMSLPTGKRLQLLDIDLTKDDLNFESAQSVYDHLVNLDMSFEFFEMLIVPSSSCGVRLNGELLKGYNWHVWLVVDATVVMSQFENWSQGVSFLGGDGFVKFRKNGKPDAVCSFDSAVYSHERVVYASKPSLFDGFTKDKIDTFYQSGTTITINDIEDINYHQIKNDLLDTAEIEEESKKIADQYIEDKVKDAVSKGISETDARKSAVRQCNNTLTMNSIIELSNGEKITISEMCFNHDKYDQLAIPDPIEGREYGTTTAMFYWNDGQPKIHSFAHGENLVYDIEDDHGNIVILFDDIENEVKEQLDDCGFDVIGETKESKKQVMSVTTIQTFINQCSNLENATQVSKLLEKASALKLDELSLKPLSEAIIKGSKAFANFTASEIKRNYNIEVAKREAKESEKKGGFVDDHVFISSRATYLNKLSCAEIGVRAWNVNFNRITPTNQDGDILTAEQYSNNIIECVHDTMYVPFLSEKFTYNNVDYYNIYRPNKLNYVKVGTTDVVDRLIAHTEMIIPNEREREILFSFIAHQVQNTGKLLYWALVLQGIQGNGKSLYAVLLEGLLGSKNVNRVTANQFGGKFNNWAANSCLNIVDELKIDTGKNQYDVVNHIKPLITDEHISIEGKGKDVVTAKNVANYFCTSNFKDCIPLDDGDRRWAVIFTENETLNLGDDYFPNLYNAIRENIEELYTFFKNYQIPSWINDNKRAPLTDAKNELIRLSVSSVEQSLFDAIDEFSDQVIQDGKLDITKLTARAKDLDRYVDDFPKTRAINKILLKHGYVSLDKRERVGGELHRFYRLP